MKLAETQRLVWQLITAPEGIAAAVAEDAIADADLGRLVRAGRALDAVQRLEVYANAYFQRIHTVLGNDLPALAAALGPDAFHDLTTSYLLVCPPRHPSLRHAGEQLAGFIAQHDAARGVRERAPWAADLARLEWAMVDAFDAPDQPALERGTLADLAPAAFATLKLALRSGAQLLELGFPAGALRAAHADGAPLPLPLTAAQSRVLVWRHSERVRFRSIDADEATGLALVAGTTRFDRLCEEAACRAGDRAAPTVTAGWLARWVEDGVLAAL